MKKILLLFCFAAWVLCASAQGSLTLMVFTVEKDSLVSPVVVDSKGLIESDPVFSETTPELYYLRKKEEFYEIVAFNHERNEIRTVVVTTDALSALRITPDGKWLTCIRKQNDRSSSLVKYPIAGGDAALVLSLEIDNYMWMDDNNLLITAPGKPNSLHLLSLRPQKKISIAQHVGKSLAHSRKTGSFAFVHKLSVDSWSIKSIHTDGSISILAETFSDGDVFTLTAEGIPLHANEGDIYKLVRRGDWKPFLSAIRMNEIKALQINTAGSKLAVLTDPNPSTHLYGE